MLLSTERVGELFSVLDHDHERDQQPVLDHEHDNVHGHEHERGPIRRGGEVVFARR